MVLASWRFCERGSFSLSAVCLTVLDTQHWASGSVILDSVSCHSKRRIKPPVPAVPAVPEAADPVPTVYRPFCQKRRTVFYPEDPTPIFSIVYCLADPHLFYLFLFYAFYFILFYFFFFSSSLVFAINIIPVLFLLNYCHYHPYYLT